MQFVRFKKNENVKYGILRRTENILEIEGEPFSKYKETGIYHNINDVKLLVPCIPTKIFGVGLNFLDHINELGLEIPKAPANFMKPNSSICNPNEDIVIPKIAKRVDYEGELAVIIGKTIKDASEEEAADAIFGVTPFNDVTEREISYTTNLVTKSKAFDTFSCYGPILDTEINWRNVTIRTYLNGNLVQQGNTKDMLFSPAKIVSYLSQGVTFYPGDIITTGTPQHVLALKDGDIVEVEIEGIDIKLKNSVFDSRIH